MIKLDFPRDAKGRYVMSFGYLMAIGAKQQQDEDNTHFALNLGQSRYYLKFCGNTFSDSAELLFSKFCERNHVPCAKIDLAVDEDNPGSKPYIISQEVVPSGCTMVPSDGVLWPAAGGYSSNLGEYYANAKAYARARGLELEDGFYTSLLKMTLLDYLTANFDRSCDKGNGGNLKLYIKDKGGAPQIGLCPLFDNEYCFALDTFTYALGKNPVREKCTEADIMNALRFTNIKDKTYPALGILKDGENPNMFLTALAHEIDIDPQVGQLLSGLDTNFKSMADEIKAETGIEIPKVYVDFASRLVESRKVAMMLKLSEIESEINAEFDEEMGGDE